MSPVLSLLFTLLLFGGFIALIFALRRREASAVQRGFVAAGSTDARVQGSDTVVGTVQGVPLRCTLYQGGKHSPGSTVIETSTPQGMPPCEIHLSSQSARDRRLVERGLEIDLELGDPSFDAEVVVEAAPAEVVRAVLDPHLRARVRMLMPCNVHVAGGKVTLRKTGKITNPQDVGTLVASMVYLAGRLGQVAGELGAERMAALGQQGVGGYRGVGAADAGAAFAPPGALEELARLQQVRRQRIRRGRMFSFGFMAVAFGGWALVAVTISSRHGSTSSPRPPSSVHPTSTSKPAPSPSAAATGAGATARPGTFHDTEGRSFIERSGSGSVAYVDPAQAGVAPLAPPNPSYGTPAFGLWFDTHFVRVCDGYRDATGLRAVYDGCRPVTCNADADCPTPRGESTMVECIHGWCGVRAAPMDVNDVVAACMAGTGPDWHGAAQKALLAKARACTHSPCAVPAGCKVP